MIAAENNNVCSLSTLDLLLSKVLVPKITDLEKTLTVGVKVLLLHLDFRQVDVDIFVHVPILLGNGVRVMWVGKRDSQGKRSLLGTFSDVVPKVLSALEHDLLIVVKLVASATGTSLKNGAGIMVPLKACIGLVPVYSPAEITRVNVAGQTLLIAVELVTNKVHLASKRSVVALGA
ncbi:hypothetical protein HG530_011201 [Fusarium avenaceum]|nr:hypothetical protein HG530_011201 [Fusarium avenaceum]